MCLNLLDKPASSSEYFDEKWNWKIGQRGDNESSTNLFGIFAAKLCDLCTKNLQLYANRNTISNGSNTEYRF